MVKFSGKVDCDLSTSPSICSESQIVQPETLGQIVSQLPKMSTQERKRTMLNALGIKGSSKKWSQAETKIFYELLGHFGLDFTMMSYHQAFSKRRSQKELSNKYKKQMKKNPNSIETVLNRIDRDGLYGGFSSICEE